MACADVVRAKANIAIAIDLIIGFSPMLCGDNILKQIDA
jgi:hypothetical protein